MNWQSLALHRFLLRLLAPRRARFAFCRAHQARRIVGCFEQPLHAARLLKKFKISAHECSAAPISDIEISITSGFPLNLLATEEGGLPVRPLCGWDFSNLD